MANLHLSYEEFKAFYGDLGITYWTKYNYLDLDYVGKYNVWDEEIKMGYSISGVTGADVETANAWCSKNYIELSADKTYYLESTYYINARWYDSDKNYLGYSVIGANSAFTPSSVFANAKYLRFNGIGSTYNNDIRIYQPVMNLGRVDLGSLNNWNYVSAKNCFYARYDTGISFTSGGELNVAYCSKYEQATAYNFDANSQDMSFSINNNRLSSEQRIWVRDTTCLTTVDIKNNNIGISIVYKKS